MGDFTSNPINDELFDQKTYDKPVEGKKCNLPH
jgi:hypothetical protein